MATIKVREKIQKVKGRVAKIKRDKLGTLEARPYFKLPGRDPATGNVYPWVEIDAYDMQSRGEQPESGTDQSFVGEIAEIGYEFQCDRVWWETYRTRLRTLDYAVQVRDSTDLIPCTMEGNRCNDRDPFVTLTLREIKKWQP